MLRLLQKKLTAPQTEFTKHLLFVLSAHCIILMLLLVTSKTVTHLVLNVRTFKKNDNVIIKWRATQKKQSIPVKTVSHKTEAPAKIEQVKKNKPVPAQKPAPKPFSMSGKFSKIVSQSSPIDLGPKKKKKQVNSSYQVPRPPQIPEVIEPPQAQKEVITESVSQEPLVLSVHDYNQQQESFEIVDAIRRWWQPPLGVRPDAECLMLVTVTSTGECQEIIVQQSSGIPAYDISAKSALLKCKLPKHIWGKQCVLQF